MKSLASPRSDTYQDKTENVMRLLTMDPPATLTGQLYVGSYQGHRTTRAVPLFSADETTSAGL